MSDSLCIYYKMVCLALLTVIYDIVYYNLFLILVFFGKKYVFGTGRDAVYTGRMQLDAASLNRFVTIPVGYDAAIDRYCAAGDEQLLAFVEAYRGACKQCGTPSVLSYRNIKMMKAYEPVMLREQVVVLALVKDLGADDVGALLGTGLFDMDSHWCRALRDCVEML